MVLKPAQVRSFSDVQPIQVVHETAAVFGVLQETTRIRRLAWITVKPEVLPNQLVDLRRYDNPRVPRLLFLKFVCNDKRLSEAVIPAYVKFSERKTSANEKTAKGHV